MSALLWVMVIVASAVGPTLLIVLWHRARNQSSPVDSRIAIAEAHIALAANSGRPEDSASMIAEAATLYMAIASDCSRVKVAEVYLRMADRCNAQVRAIREHARLYP